MNNKISVTTGLAFFIAGCLLSYLVSQHLSAKSPSPSNLVSARHSASNNDCEVTTFRNGGFQFTSPLLYVEKSCESSDYMTVKNDVKKMIADFKASNDITTASVYLRDFEHSRWMGVNEHEGYHPGSLSKVPLMMAYLHKLESDPRLLDEEYLFEAPPKGTLPVQHYVAESIEPGKKYKVRDLLRYMVSFSDNNATWLLSEKLGLKNYEKTFLDLGVTIPIKDPSDDSPRISARDYSVFFRALYNASYLSEANSEFALKLLNESSFTDGFVKGLPNKTQVVHKFAEWDNGSDFELHESGIFYHNGKAFLITIMTSGKNREKLPNVIASITRSIYDQVTEP